MKISRHLKYPIVVERGGKHTGAKEVVYGPFKNLEEAANWAETYLTCNWVIDYIEPPYGSKEEEKEESKK